MLRTKVAVFVDLFRKTEQVRRQAESLRRGPAQLQKLAAASVAINGALSIERMLQTVTDTARDIVGAHQAITLFLVSPRGGQRRTRTTSRLARLRQVRRLARGEQLQLDAIADAPLVADEPHGDPPDRSASCEEHPDWDVVRQAAASRRSAAACWPPR